MTSPKDTINYLELTPAHIHGHEENADNKISILVPRFTGKFWSKILMPNMKRKFIHVKLDEFGSATWKLIDGKINVQQICDSLNEKFGEKIHPVEERVTMFLTELLKNDFIELKELKK